MFFCYCQSSKIIFAHQSPNYSLHRSCAHKNNTSSSLCISEFMLKVYNIINMLWILVTNLVSILRDYEWVYILHGYFWWACIQMIYHVKVFSTCRVIAIQQLFGWTSLFISRRRSIFLSFILCETYIVHKHVC